MCVSAFEQGLATISRDKACLLALSDLIDCLVPILAIEKPSSNRNFPGIIMDYTYIEPKLPTLRRLISLNRKHSGESMLRMLEYEALEEVDISGKVLDLGGGENSKYRADLPTDIDYHSINIDPDIAPTWLVQPGEGFPVEDNTFDCCISLNTLEHVFDARFLIGEVFRTLKPGASLIITVPWMFRIHGHPDDFSRCTPSWWRAAMEEAGFSSTSVQPLVWGRKNSAASIGGFGIFKKLNRFLVPLADIVYAKLTFMGGNGLYSGARGLRVCGVAEGHMIIATK